MLTAPNHKWDLSLDEARALQRELAERVSTRDDPEWPATIAGIDVGFEGPGSTIARAAVVVLRLPDLGPVEAVVARRPVTFPYVPGLLAFRECPVILDAMQQLANAPEVLMVDGHGIAHPRRLGIASHLGVLLDRPAIGCAKSRLVGTFAPPGDERGAFTYLHDQGEVIGAVLRTRAHVAPVFVSPGHRISLRRCIKLVLHCATRFRLPEPTRLAHRVAGGAPLL